ncbi:hypothetical protein JT358_09450 [Micrococcales bacterium 31B]|nr:hypothetical protein [Micrococcales bacterium 31B]
MISLNRDRHRISHAIIVGTDVLVCWEVQRQLLAAGIEIIATVDPLQYADSEFGGALDTLVQATGILMMDVLVITIDGSIRPVLDYLAPGRPHALLWLVTTVDDRPVPSPPAHVRAWVVVAEEAAENWQRIHAQQVSPWNGVDTLWAQRGAVYTAAGHVAHMLRTWQLARSSAAILGATAVTVKACSIARNRVKLEAEVSWEPRVSRHIPWSAWLRFQAQSGEFIEVPLSFKNGPEKEGLCTGEITTRHEIGIDISQVPPGTYHMRIDLVSDAGRLISHPLQQRVHCHSVFRLPLPTQPAWDSSVSILSSGSVKVTRWNDTPDARRWTRVCSDLQYVESPVLHSGADFERWGARLVFRAHAQHAAVLMIDALHLVDHRSTFVMDDPLRNLLELLRELGYTGQIVIPRLRIASRNANPRSDFLDVVQHLNADIEVAESQVGSVPNVQWTAPVQVLVDEEAYNRHDIVWSHFVDYAQLQREVWKALQFHCELSLSQRATVR